jgi:hypothetical protein
MRPAHTRILPYLENIPEEVLITGTTRTTPYRTTQHPQQLFN